MSDDLYDRDFYLWTQGQGAALRARRFGDNVLEIDRIAEEIEDLGSAQRNKAASFAQRIIEHFYKLSAGGNVDPIRHWLVEVINFRQGLARALTPAIRGELESEWDRLHRRAFRAANMSTKLFEPDLELDSELRWTFDQVTGEGQNDPFGVFAAALAEADRPMSRPL